VIFCRVPRSWPVECRQAVVLLMPDSDDSVPGRPGGGRSCAFQSNRGLRSRRARSPNGRRAQRHRANARPPVRQGATFGVLRIVAVSLVRSAELQLNVMDRALISSRCSIRGQRSSRSATSAPASDPYSVRHCRAHFGVCATQIAAAAACSVVRDVKCCAAINRTGRREDGENLQLEGG